jgi:DHA1 family tetracycline resistance protein-like MFS transporter
VALTFGLAGGIMWFALGVPLMSLLGLAGPGLLGLMTRRINPASQGQLQGALGSVTAISQMIGPGLFSFLFAHSLATHGAPGTPFYVAAGLLAVAAMVAARSGGGDASIAAA